LKIFTISYKTNTGTEVRGRQVDLGAGVMQMQ
jgi:hypothetical protein